MLDGELIFIPGEMPRQGVFAHWGRGTGSAKLELVFPGGTYGIRKRLVSADLIPLGEALPALVALDAGEPMRLSGRAWAAAAAAGLGLIARGRLLPTVGADGTDVWRAGPLDPADLSWMRQLAAAFPAAAHALAVPGSRPMRLRSPEALIRAFWDAIADLVARSPAATRTTASPAFAAVEPTPVGDLADWLADTTDGLAAGACLGLRIEAVPSAPMNAADVTDEQDEGADEEDEAGADGSEPAFRLVLQLRSNADPSLIVDAAALWSQPETVLSRFGAQAETDLLLALRRGAPIWPPLAEALRHASPSVIGLDDDTLTSLLGPAAEELAGAGIEVLWPSSLLGDGLKLRAIPTPAPDKLTGAGFGLEALLDFRWQLTLGGAQLDADEIAALAEAKRPLVRLRGRWVLLDPALLDRLRQPPRTRMRTSEALGAVLAGSAEIDGETVTVVAEGPLADLAARIAGIAAAPDPVEPPPGLTASAGMGGFGHGHRHKQGSGVCLVSPFRPIREQPNSGACCPIFWPMPAPCGAWRRPLRSTRQKLIELQHISIRIADEDHPAPAAVHLRAAGENGMFRAASRARSSSRRSTTKATWVTPGSLIGSS